MPTEELNVGEELNKVWSILSEKQRVIRSERIYRKLKRVADLQLPLLNKHKKIVGQDTVWAFYYLFEVVKSFWRDGEFAIALGKNKWSFYAIYPTRTMMEKMLKLNYFSNQRLEEQNKIAKKELLRHYMRLYRVEKEEGRQNKGYEDQYKKIDDKNDFPDIDKAREEDFKSFPKSEEMCLKSKLPDAKKLYFSYRYLSGLLHGELLSLVIVSLYGQGKEEYRRSMMLIIRFCTEVLKLTDFHLEHKTQKEVEAVIIETGKIASATPRSR